MLFARLALMFQVTIGPKIPVDTFPAVYPMDIMVQVDANIINQLTDLADSAKIEYVRCGIGDNTSNSVRVSLIIEPKMNYQTTDSAGFEDCPAGTQFNWHNHLVKDGYEAAELCVMSQEDANYALTRNIPVFFVGVPGGLCWWTKPQIAKLRAFGAEIIPTIPSQRWFRKPKVAPRSPQSAGSRS